jgi:hypothetical protein
MHDRRCGGVMEAILSFGPHHLVAQFAYSTESDYISYGGALNYSLDLNGKNTTLNLGWSHNWDTILPGNSPFIFQNQHKDTDDLLVGVNQLLSPKTILTGNFTFRNSHGYLDDPYRGVLFEDAFQADLNKPILYPEHRPGFRQSYIGYLSLVQFVTPFQGSLEGSYRPYYDSFGVVSHTLALSWHQKIDVFVEIAFCNPVLHLLVAIAVAATALEALPATIGVWIAALAAASLSGLAVTTVVALWIHPEPWRTVLSFALLPVYAIWRIGVLAGTLVTLRDVSWRRTARASSNVPVTTRG